MSRDSSLLSSLPLVPERYDAVTDCEYDAASNMTSCKFRNGGISGAVLSTLTLTYDSNGNITTAVRS